MKSRLKKVAAAQGALFEQDGKINIYAFESIVDSCKITNLETNFNQGSPATWGNDGGSPEEPASVSIYCNVEVDFSSQNLTEDQKQAVISQIGSDAEVKETFYSTLGTNIRSAADGKLNGGTPDHVDSMDLDHLDFNGSEFSGLKFNGNALVVEFNFDE